MQLEQKHFLIKGENNTFFCTCGADFGYYMDNTNNDNEANKEALHRIYRNHVLSSFGSFTSEIT